eukprot:CAMPEP_0174261484 /NCGR_PEP_ID=MMETSP0439-20130205/11460_1 /TAXON_ID=0 /ORGANISM="Stereomyxa ramosa, Strain Chinc5" /LENGTH=147 /DNA_ID=CAMNT_0015345965 /DNA_START=77 /DNA_END=516 /DNA_ORIENTATION=+
MKWVLVVVCLWHVGNCGLTTLPPVDPACRSFRWLEVPEQTVNVDSNSLEGTRIARFLPNTLRGVQFFITTNDLGRRREAEERGGGEVFEIDDKGNLFLAFDLNGFVSDFIITVEAFQCFNSSSSVLTSCDLLFGDPDFVCELEFEQR